MNEYDAEIQNDHKRRTHPKQRANFLSRFTFLYNLSIVWNVYKKGTFSRDDLFEVINNCKAKNVGDELDKCLKNELKSSGALSIIKILWNCYGSTYLIVGIIQFIVRSAVIIFIPMILSKIILYFQPNQQELTKSDVINYAALLMLLNFLNVTYLHNYLFYLYELGIKIKTALSSVIFRKSLRLTTQSLSSISVGKIVTLLTTDVAMLESFIWYFNDIWVGVIQVVIVFYMIFNKMGAVACAGMGFFILVVPLQVILGKLTSRLRLSSSKGTDNRLQVTKETLTNIRVIKMNNWEDVFEDRINTNRKKEMSAMLRLFLSKTSVILLGNLTSKIAYYLLLTVYILSGYTFTAELIYYLTALFLRIRHALNVSIPIGLTSTADTLASIKRIKEFLLTEEIIQRPETNYVHKTPLVSFTDFTISLSNENLKVGDIELDSGLIVVTGPTGSGKTTFLKSILGEYSDCSAGTINKCGRVSYAPQEPWIFPSSLKRNIVFDQVYDKERYQRVLEACALNYDIGRLRFGDDSQIIDGGSNLSKGQQCRINLARCLYRKADIYLIDDCLTSLDINIQKEVIRRGVKEFLGDKLCIFVTQNLGFVEKNDKILLVDEGKVIMFEKKFLEDEELKSFHREDRSGLGVIVSEENNETDTATEDTTLLGDEKKENVFQEKVKQGKVEFKAYRKYGKFGGGVPMMMIILIVFVLTQISKSYNDMVLSNWVNVIHENTSQIKIENHADSDLYFKLYSIFTLTVTVLSIFSAFLLFNFSRTASMKMHKYVIESVINAAVIFFDTNLIGNIINRFSKDLSIVDEQIPFAVYEFIENVLGICGVVTLIAVVNITLIIPSISMFILLYFLRRFYMPTGRSLQRLETTTRGPVMSYLNSSLQGLVTIRAFRAEHTVIEEFDRYQDINTSATYTSKCCSRTFAYYLDVCCTFYSGIIVAALIFFDKSTSVGDVGLAITQAVTLNGIGYGIRQWAEIENKMTSVERILEYADIEREESTRNSEINNWPELNSVQFDNVTFSYGTKYVLENVNFLVNAGEKLGIVGRTGSGKSTLSSLLFRFYNYKGTISIGGVDIRDIPLKILRSNISIIPQNPTLFSTTFRQNLDPENKHSDDNIWNVLKTVQLENAVRSLDAKLNDSGLNLSTGQKQLVCLARCLLSNNKIIVLDEVASDVDHEHEIMMESVFKKYFKDCTLLVIAHKLETVFNCDKVLVMEDGKIVEFGKVNDLGQNTDGVFSSMLQKYRLMQN